MVVFGISLGSVPYVAPKLSDVSPAWKAMVENLPSTRTMASQLWFSSDAKRMGSTPGNVVAGYAQYLNTWADMSHLLVREAWPSDTAPQNVAYMCGPMPGGIPDPSDPTVPDVELARGTGMMRDWMASNTGFLWPGITLQNDPQTFDPAFLVVPPDANPVDPFAAQYWRVNIDPSERYNLSLPNTLNYRIWPGETGIENLVVAGDWTQNVINAGCVEAAVISGMKASQAICGAPADHEISHFWRS
jgi:hypothetical protein